MKKVVRPSYLVLLVFFVANFFLWSVTKTIRLPWTNVPSVPEYNKAAMLTLGDKQLAYRYYALMLQNLGSIGGRDVSLLTMDYSKLEDWFFLEHYLDPESNTVPMLAARYFGAINDNDRLNHVINYLEVAGQRPTNQKWRWLGHAVFLARHIQKDNDRALELAYKLSANKAPDLGTWAKQMPVFILNEQGDTDLAYKIMLNILISNVDTMHPNEIFYMKDYICNTILKEDSISVKPEFCFEIK